MKKSILFVLYLTIIWTCIPLVSAEAYCAYGSRGEEVEAVQERLHKYGYYKMKPDGIFGVETKKALVNYQKNCGLEADGIAGSKTLASLKIISKNDLDLLAMVISGESRGESYEGQVAVGAVVLNRVNHPAFPDTIKEVIFQKGAFSAVDDGQIKKKVSETSRKAAKAAYSGFDPTGGAIYYYNPKTATCDWIRTRKAIKQIGNHLFCI